MHIGVFAVLENWIPERAIELALAYHQIMTESVLTYRKRNLMTGQQRGMPMSFDSLFVIGTPFLMILFTGLSGRER
jgi:hypothetical protein